MHEHIRINNINHRMIEYILTQDEGPYKEFRIYINPSFDIIGVDIDDDFEILHKGENERIENRHLNVQGISFAICAR